MGVAISCSGVIFFSVKINNTEAQPTAPTNKLVIEGSCNGIQLDKRFYLPGIVLKSTCPTCNLPWVWDGDEQYVSYPVSGEPKVIHASCEQCDEEWEAGKLVVRVTVEAI